MSKNLKGNCSAILTNTNAWDMPAISDITELCPIDEPVQVGDTLEEGDIPTNFLDGILASQHSGANIFDINYRHGQGTNRFLSNEINTGDPMSDTQKMSPAYLIIRNIDGAEYEISDLLYECLSSFLKNTVTHSEEILTTKDGLRSIMCESLSLRLYTIMDVDYTTDCTVTIKYDDGKTKTFDFYADNVDTLEPFAQSGNVTITISSIMFDKILETFEVNVPEDKAPYPPIISEGIDENGVYISIENKYYPATGNIYLNGGVSPVSNYNSPNGMTKYYPTVAGNYTADEIVNVSYYHVYSKLSNILTIEQKNDSITITFNEYTGRLTAVTTYNSVSNYILYRKNGAEWENVAENSEGIFLISESGTYKVGAEAKPIFTVTESSEISVEAVLDSPKLYIDYSNPSQLGFDEVDNATEYDVYKMNENGEFELYETIKSENNVAMLRSISVNRKLKIFNVVTK